MRYACLIYEASDPTADYPQEQRDAEMRAYMEFTDDIVSRGIMQGGEALVPPQSATSVRVDGGDRIVSDGPFAETKEWLAGFYLIECDDLDAAIEVAARIPAAKHGTVEVRPIMEIPAEYQT